MRPFKHVAIGTRGSEPTRYQNILGIDLATFRAPWGEVPVVATTEAERITLYYWNAAKSQWDHSEQPHQRLTADGTAVDAPTNWNWSDRVAIACSATTVYVVSKRQRPGELPSVTIDRFVPANDQTLRQLEPVTLRLAAGTQIGRSLWATCDQTKDELLLLLQISVVPTVIGPPHPFPGSFALAPASWELALIQLRIDQNNQLSSTSKKVGDGGFDLDARFEDGRLLAVFRHTPEAFRIPAADLFGGTEVGSGSDADPFYERLQLATINPGTLEVTTRSIPGGEHPQIHFINPVLITMDRPARIDLNSIVELNTSTVPPTIAASHFFWSEGRIDKIAWLREGSETFRGTLLTSDAPAIPRSHTDISQATHLFEFRNDNLSHAAPFRHFPVCILGLDRSRKGLTLDVLHHREFLGLFRTRLTATTSQGVLSVTHRAFEVWDIGHGQIGDPTAVFDPPEDGENSQFAPFAKLGLTASTNVTVDKVVADNTMGGHLVADTSQQPVGFFAYSDLGDGCLRVIFAPDIPALGDPPPVGNEKTLRPEQVTGPHLPCDEWVELRAADFVESGLVSYSVGVGHATDQDRSIGSGFEVPTDTLLNACELVSLNAGDCGGAPLVPLDGLTRDQLVDVDALRSTLAPASLTITLSDGRSATITMTVKYPKACGTNAEEKPAGLFIVDLAVTLSVEVEGAQPRALWTLTPLRNVLGQELPAGPIVPGGPDATFSPLQIIGIGNNATITPWLAGRQRLSIFITDGLATNAPSAALDVEVQESAYLMIKALYDGVASGEFYAIGDLTVRGLEYEINYLAVPDDSPKVKIAIQPQRATELRFRGHGFAQGSVDCAQILSFSSKDMKLKFGLDLDGFIQVDDFKLTIHYGRPFTPGMLMRDVRSRDILTGQSLGADGFDLVKRNEPARHAAIGAKPSGDARIYNHKIDVHVSMTFWGISIPALLTALAVIGAAGIAETVIALYGAFLAAVAVGVIGIAVALACAVALAIYISVAVPPAIQDFIKAKVEEQFSSGDILQNLNSPPVDSLVRYSGEGAAEAIARKVLAEAQLLSSGVPGPADSEDQENAGLDRFRGQIFQMTFVSDGVCRVLVRLDDCLDQPNQGTSGNPPGHGNPPGITTGNRS